MTESDALFLIGTVVVPVILFIMNLILRRAFHRPLTAGADWLLLVAAFDATALVTVNDLQPLIHDHFIRDIAVATFSVLLLVSIVAWFFSVGILEIKLEQAQSNSKKLGIIFWFGFSWIIAASVTAINVLVFTWRTAAL